MKKSDAFELKWHIRLESHLTFRNYLLPILLSIMIMDSNFSWRSIASVSLKNRLGAGACLISIVCHVESEIFGKHTKGG